MLNDLRIKNGSQLANKLYKIFFFSLKFSKFISVDISIIIDFYDWFQSHCTIWKWKKEYRFSRILIHLFSTIRRTHFIHIFCFTVVVSIILEICILTFCLSVYWIANNKIVWTFPMEKIILGYPEKRRWRLAAHPVFNNNMFI